MQIVKFLNNRVIFSMSIIIINFKIYKFTRIDHILVSLKSISEQFKFIPIYIFKLKNFSLSDMVG